MTFDPIKAIHDAVHHDAPKPSIGRIVQFRLSAQDAEAINRRRTNSESIAARLKYKPAEWPVGAQAHIGNNVVEGQVFPMIIVAIWSDTCVNGQAFLDGNDTFWVLSAQLGDGTGVHQWNWPPRV